MRKIIFTSFLLTNLFLCNQFSNAQCHLDDWTALKALYESTKGSNWANNSGWDVIITNLNEPPANCDLSTLFGISLNDARRVNSIFLLINNLQGNIPTEIEKLSELEDLILNYNSLTGSIPPELGDLPNIFSIYLDDNNLTAFIPSELGNLSTLRFLRLNNNLLRGEIPVSLGFLELENLWLSNNNLSGCLSPDLEELCYLTDTEVWDCD